MRQLKLKVVRTFLEKAWQMPSPYMLQFSITQLQENQHHHFFVAHWLGSVPKMNGALFAALSNSRVFAPDWYIMLRRGAVEHDGHHHDEVLTIFLQWEGGFTARFCCSSVPPFRFDDPDVDFTSTNTICVDDLDTFCKNTVLKVLVHCVLRGILTDLPK